MIEPILQLVRGEREADVCCASHHRPSKLARMTGEGIHFWCREHREEVIIPWTLVDAARERFGGAERQGLSSGEISVAVASLTRMR